MLGGTPANYEKTRLKNTGTAGAAHEQHGTRREIEHMTFTDFVTFLVDKEGKFKEVKEQYDALYYPNSEHWQPYYE